MIEWVKETSFLLILSVFLNTFIWTSFKKLKHKKYIYAGHSAHLISQVRPKAGAVGLLLPGLGGGAHEVEVRHLHLVPGGKEKINHFSEAAKVIQPAKFEDRLIFNFLSSLDLEPMKNARSPKIWAP